QGERESISVPLQPTVIAVVTGADRSWNTTFGDMAPALGEETENPFRPGLRPATGSPAPIWPGMNGASFARNEKLPPPERPNRGTFGTTVRTTTSSRDADRGRARAR